MTAEKYTPANQPERVDSNAWMHAVNDLQSPLGWAGTVQWQRNPDGVLLLCWWSFHCYKLFWPDQEICPPSWVVGWVLQGNIHSQGGWGCYRQRQVWYEKWKPWEWSLHLLPLTGEPGKCAAAVRISVHLSQWKARRIALYCSWLKIAIAI